MRRSACASAHTDRRLCYSLLGKYDISSMSSLSPAQARVFPGGKLEMLDLFAAILLTVDRSASQTVSTRRLINVILVRT